jgi:hypothetical protein
MAIKAREVRERLQRKTDADLLYVLMALAEEQSVINHKINDLAAMIDQIASINVMMVEVAGNMKSVINRITQKDNNDELGNVTE